VVLLLAAALAGLGIAGLSSLVAAEALREGRLVGRSREGSSCLVSF
jgi:DNA-binding transcriptional LysR family regulator